MKVSLKKIGLFLILLGFIANVSIAGQNPVATNTAFSKRYIPVMKREVAFVGLGTLEIGRDWGVGTQAQRSHPSDTIAQQTLKTCGRIST
ncbi:MAG: hypothetical protein K0S29_93 [Gammaproteobacteria bacterium]|nr:hypothetical protein [Gammaproteobacteria bacterium]